MTVSCEAASAFGLVVSLTPGEKLHVFGSQEITLSFCSKYCLLMFVGTFAKS
jgi:hypothetical protein